MCGTPYAEYQGRPAEAMTAVGYPQLDVFSQAAAIHQQAVGYEQTTALPHVAADPLGQLPPHRPTHAQPVDAGFDSLFRRPEGELNPHSRTQLIPPVDADYRLPPPGTQDGSPFGSVPGQPAFPQAGGGYPPGPGSDEDEDWNEDEPGVRKPVLWGTISAVVVASAVILGLLYIGSHNNGAAAATSTGSSSAGVTTAASAQNTIGSVNLQDGSPVASASASPSASASASASASVAAGSTGLPLQQGSTGTYVQYVQTRLRQLNYYHGQITKNYDAATAQAVSAFQAHANVTGDPSGTVGQSTLTALISAGSRPNLKLGNRSADVRRLQQSLNSADNAGLNVSGRYDEATMAAVLAYQSRVGVAATGSMDSQTWAALQSGKIA
jgi:peptidoglycan hydrolase-like protein with peptidoglycan-binding domain